MNVKKEDAEKQGMSMPK